MLDLRLRPLKERLLGRTADALGRHVGADAITVAALVVTLAAAALAASGRPWPALAGWLVGRILDGLDGPVARIRGTASDLGGYLDIVADTIGYAAVPIGVAYGVDERGTWIAVAVLLGTFFVNTISWTFLAAVMEKQGAGAKQNGEITTVTMPPALIEGTETIVLFSIFVAFPSAAETTFWLMAALVSVNVVQRMVWAQSRLRCREVALVLQTYLDGELDEPRSAAVARHLSNCDRCGLEAEVYEQLIEALAARAQPEPDVAARLQQFAANLVR